MTTDSQTKSIYDLARSEVDALIDEIGQPSYRARQIWQAIYTDGAESVGDISTLPVGLREQLQARFTMPRPEPLLSRHSKDDSVDKVLFRLTDGELIETVLMRYHPRGGSRPRRTVCISTQAGCALGCTFCATGQQGFRRHLTPGEIVSQVTHMNRVLASTSKGGEVERVTNVVFMGMGEPLANYDNTLKAVAILNDPEGIRLGARNMTISTVGLVPQIIRLAKEPYQVNLAVSLHAPNDRLRSRIMPVNARWNIAALIAACNKYIESTNRRISFEYVLIAGENDKPVHAEELAGLLHGMLCHVNIIPVNATEARYDRPDPGRIGKFKDLLRRAGIPATVRFEKGTDIDAGCGQLRARAIAATD
jgi:23S rRNA (adenine2503-C2)-methyltransferase